MDFDKNRAVEIVNQLEPKPGSELSVSQYRVILRAHVESMADPCRRQLVRCAQGRAHTPITRMQRELRETVTFHGDSLVNLDARNSQPFILGLIVALEIDGQLDTQYLDLKAGIFKKMKEGTKGKEEERKGRTGKYVSLLDPNAIVDSSSVIYPGSVCDYYRKSLPPDLVSFLEVTASGMLYETLGLCSSAPAAERDAFKKGFFEILFGPAAWSWNSAVWHPIRTQFPTIHNALLRLKRPDHGHAARMMQAVEAAIYIEAIGGQLVREPDLPFQPIHDSWLIRPADIGRVAKVTRDVFAPLGVISTLKVDVTPDDLRAAGLHPADQDEAVQTRCLASATTNAG